MKLYDKGFIFEYGGLYFKKLDNQEWGTWVCLNSYYPVQIEKGVYENHPEYEKPLYDEHGHLNRYGFKWTDHQIKEYYNL